MTLEKNPGVDCCNYATYTCSVCGRRFETTVDVEPVRCPYGVHE